jgi:hypothetical protein
VTDSALLAAIQANPIALAQANAGQDNACAATISATLPPLIVSPTKIDAEQLCAAFATAGNPLEAVTLLNVLQTLGTTGFPTASPTPIPANPIATMVLGWLNQLGRGADISNPALLAMLQTLSTSTVSGTAILSSSIVSTVLSLCQKPSIVSHGQVSGVWLQFRPGGLV